MQVAIFGRCFLKPVAFIVSIAQTLLHPKMLWPGDYISAAFKIAVILRSCRHFKTFWLKMSMYGAVLRVMLLTKGAENYKVELNGLLKNY